MDYELTFQVHDKLQLSLRVSLSCCMSCHAFVFLLAVTPCLLITDQMPQKSQVSWIALRGCFLNIFVFAIVFLLVMSCLLITLIKCIKGHKSFGSLFEGLCLCLCQVMSPHHSDRMSQISQIFSMVVFFKTVLESFNQ